MQPGWIVLGSSAVADGTRLSVPIRYALVHPRVGVALLSIMPDPITPDAPERLRQLLGVMQFRANFGGWPPILYRHLPPGELPRLAGWLGGGFAREAPLRLRGGDAWVGVALRALTTSAAESAADPPACSFRKGTGRGLGLVRPVSPVRPASRSRTARIVFWAYLLVPAICGGVLLSGRSGWLSGFRGPAPPPTLAARMPASGGHVVADSIATVDVSARAKLTAQAQPSEDKPVTQPTVTVDVPAPPPTPAAQPTVTVDVSAPPQPARNLAARTRPSGDRAVTTLGPTVDGPASPAAPAQVAEAPVRPASPTAQIALPERSGAQPAIPPDASATPAPPPVATTHESGTQGPPTAQLYVVRPAPEQAAPPRMAASAILAHRLSRAPIAAARRGPDGVDEHCRAIILKVELGEEPSNADRAYLRHGCQGG